MRTLTTAVALVLLGACSKSQPATSIPAEEVQTVEEPPAIDTELPQRQQLSAAECEAVGGTVIGDIGDGAVHQPDYMCPNSGEAPIGSIVEEGEGPIGIEGAVCCI